MWRTVNFETKSKGNAILLFSTVTHQTKSLANRISGFELWYIGLVTEYGLIL